MPDNNSDPQDPLPNISEALERSPHVSSGRNIVWGESLSEYARQWDIPDEMLCLVSEWRLIGFYEKRVPNGLEVIAFDAGSGNPNTETLRRVHRMHQNNRPTPVLVAALYTANGELRAKVAGPDSRQNSFWLIKSVEALEKVVKKALEKPDRITAIRFLLEMLPKLAAELPGLHNAGLFATHELRQGVPRLDNWAELITQAAQLLDKRGRELVEALGFEIENLPDHKRLHLLTVNQHQKAIAIFLKDDESYDIPESAFSSFSQSPISDALLAADRHNVKWVIITRSSEIRLYATKSETGVGGGSRTEKYLELNLDLLPHSAAGYLLLIFSADALSENGSLKVLVDNSSKFAAELASRLRDRVYQQTVPTLANALAQRISASPTEDDLKRAYEQVMLVLFRLLFLAYGEGRELLPVANQQYNDHSLTKTAQHMLEAINNGRRPYGDPQTTLWTGFKQLSNAINEGQPAWELPAYNGGLFSTNPDVNAEGAAIEAMPSLADRDFGPALEALLIDDSPEGKGLVDFRELSVREFGTIYEGLLESRFSVAPYDMTVNKKNLFVPAKEGDPIDVHKGKVYFHNRSGARKATGSYFTKDFAVDHLLHHALKPALDDHIERLENLLKTENEAAVSKAFFDFRCADIAMGSGHFLISTLDMIAERLASFLGEHELPSVKEELARLLVRARQELGEFSDDETLVEGKSQVEINTEMLLRRQIARHCIYGVDLHHVAVELAKVAMWVHTFVPGLPLTSFKHNLQCGNSLTGVCDLLEAKNALDYDSDSSVQSLFFGQLEAIIAEATKVSEELATARDDTVAELDLAREIQKEAEAKMKPARQLFDLATVMRAGVPVNVALTGAFDEQAIEKQWQKPEVQEAIAWLQPLHFQAAFPEVFKAGRSGFDCLLGNPPWEKVKIAKDIWWGLQAPEIKGLPPVKMSKAIEKLKLDRPDLVSQYKADVAGAERMKEFLKAGQDDLGAGDTDLFQAFAWRFYRLVREGDYLGIVLPRSAVQGKGLEKWRKTVLQEGNFSDITILKNSEGWVFDDVTPQYSIALCSIEKGEGGVGIQFRGPYDDLATYLAGLEIEYEPIPIDEFLGWSATAAFPDIPEGALGVFRKLKHVGAASSGGGATLSVHDRSPSCIRLTTNIYSPKTCKGTGLDQRWTLVFKYGNEKALACLQRRVI